MKVNNIVIVGGGSAGWMAAATLKSFYPEKNITLIESPNIPIVGVGESTLGGIRHWMYAIGINEEEFMNHVNASYKMSIKFTDFYQKDAGAFHYPFGEPVLFDAQEELNEWQGKKVVYPDTPVDDYCRTFFSAMPLIEGNKFTKDENRELPGYRSDLNVAYHFDAALFGKWLKENFCIPRGVNFISDEVINISSSENGIDSLTLSSGDIITADLFVDCTGWRSLLLGGELKEPFTSYNNILPNNRAWATQVPYVDKEKELEPYTNCTAISNGWVWNIPLWSRLGTGYVYCDKFISSEDALEEYKQYLMSNKMTVPRTREQVDSLQFRDIHIRTGIHERTWVKNVVAIGLSSGFIEPLESNGLFTTHEFLLILVSCLNRGYVTQWDKDAYNTATLEKFNNLAEFVALHYALSVRDDSDYWKDITSKTFDPSMVRNDPTVRRGFYDLVNRKLSYFKHSDEGGIHCIATGMHYFVFNNINLKYIENVHRIRIKDHVDNFIQNRKILQDRWQEIANNSPTLYQYLKDNIYHE